MSDRPLSQAFCLAADLGLALGVRKINLLPEPWVCKVNDQWTFAVNGTQEKKQCEPEGTMGAELEPYRMAVWCNGMLSAILSPYDGCFLYGCEDEFIAASESRIELEGAQVA